MLGTFAGALEARKVELTSNVTAEVKGEIEAENNVLVIKRIHVVYTLSAPEEAREVIDHVHGIHAENCPVYRSIYKAIEVTSEYRIV